METEEILEYYKRSIEAGEKRTIFDGVEARGEQFSECELRCVDWGPSDFSAAEFVDCDLRGSDFSEADMSGAKLVRCMIFDCKFPTDSSIQFVECESKVSPYSEH